LVLHYDMRKLENVTKSRYKSETVNTWLQKPSQKTMQMANLRLISYVNHALIWHQYGFVRAADHAAPR